MTQDRRDFLTAQRIELARLQAREGEPGTRCAHCGWWHHDIWKMEMAHRIACTKVNIRKWGWPVIDHIRNKALVCPDLHGGEDCNAAMNIGNRPGEAETLVLKIWAEMERVGA